MVGRIKTSKCWIGQSVILSGKVVSIPRDGVVGVQINNGSLVTLDEKLLIREGNIKPQDSQFPRTLDYSSRSEHSTSKESQGEEVNMNSQEVVTPLSEEELKKLFQFREDMRPFEEGSPTIPGSESKVVLSPGETRPKPKRFWGIKRRS